MDSLLQTGNFMSIAGTAVLEHLIQQVVSSMRKAAIYMKLLARRLFS
jgi:hypothetical protein